MRFFVYALIVTIFFSANMHIDYYSIAHGQAVVYLDQTETGASELFYQQLASFPYVRHFISQKQVNSAYIGADPSFYVKLKDIQQSSPTFEGDIRVHDIVGYYSGKNEKYFGEIYPVYIEQKALYGADTVVQMEQQHQQISNILEASTTIKIIPNQTFLNKETGKYVVMFDAAPFLSSMTKLDSLQKSIVLTNENGETLEGSLSLFYASINIGIDYSYWQLVARDFPVAQIDVQDYIKKARLRGIDPNTPDNGLVSDPQFMLVFTPKEYQQQDNTQLVILSVKSDTQAHSNITVEDNQHQFDVPQPLSLRGYKEQYNVHPSQISYIYDVGTNALDHNKISLTFKNNVYAGRVRVSTSNDKNTWKERGTDTVWRNPQSKNEIEKSSVAYTRNRDRFVRVDIVNSNALDQVAQNGGLNIVDIAVFDVYMPKVRLDLPRAMSTNDITLAYGKTVGLISPKTMRAENREAATTLVYIGAETQSQLYNIDKEYVPTTEEKIVLKQQYVIVKIKDFVQKIRTSEYSKNMYVRYISIGVIFLLVILIVLASSMLISSSRQNKPRKSHTR